MFQAAGCTKSRNGNKSNVHEYDAELKKGPPRIATKDAIPVQAGKKERERFYTKDHPLRSSQGGPCVWLDGVFQQHASRQQHQNGRCLRRNCVRGKAVDDTYDARLSKQDDRLPPVILQLVAIVQNSNETASVKIPEGVFVNIDCVRQSKWDTNDV